jgi:hypothetical protein
VVLGVLFGSVFSVINRGQLVTMRKMGVVPRFFMIARLRKTRSFAMMLGRMLVVFGRLMMMMVDAVFVHGCISWWIGWTWNLETDCPPTR